ncbi:hypothetical protein HPP92_020583 [Vanilla planifolia]|uniref:Uncharacterized protein n=1 Tax=Vanilla planifolia TaxID=51239 RepID=A0A835UIM2_VANPL|nr:hypothetical protein HPP92_020583 [Vanilla planifolia]
MGGLFNKRYGGLKTEELNGMGRFSACPTLCSAEFCFGVRRRYMRLDSIRGEHRDCDRLSRLLKQLLKIFFVEMQKELVDEKGATTMTVEVVWEVEVGFCYRMGLGGEVNEVELVSIEKTSAFLLADSREVGDGIEGDRLPAEGDLSCEGLSKLSLSKWISVGEAMKVEFLSIEKICAFLTVSGGR